MSATFVQELERKVTQQLKSQRVGYLLGAGSSYLNGAGYPLAFELWDRIKDSIPDIKKRDDIQATLDNGANGLEHALDLLDDGGAHDTPYRHLVTAAVAILFRPIEPDLDDHIEFVRRIAIRQGPWRRIFSLNYDPLIERAAARAKIRLADGFHGAEEAYFDAAVFQERIGRISGHSKAKQFGESVRPVHLVKLHGSLGWYECGANGMRRCRYGESPPHGTQLLMIPPQRRKAVETMKPPYSALWSLFRGSLAHNEMQINRLVCIGYGFGDQHVNDVVEAALARPDFTVLIFTKSLSDPAWRTWSVKRNVIVVTESRCSLMGNIGPGHVDLWSFERLSKEV